MTTTTTFHELVFRNALVVDGSGSPGRLADVGVDGRHISVIAPASTLTGRTVVDATGKVLAPGFIDIHSHADQGVVIDGRAQSSITQGITTVVTGNCGLGVGPMGDTDRWKSFVSGESLEALDGFNPYREFGDYLAEIRKRSVAVNVFPLVPHGILRAGVAGFDVRELGSIELDTMRGRLEDALDAGAIGMSTGLEYAPGQTATTDELIYLAMSVGARNGLYASHCRNRGEFIQDAADEAVAIVEQSGSRLQMSHFIRRPTGPGIEKQKAAMQTIRDARDRGIVTYFDTFPFEYGPTGLNWLLPQHVRVGLTNQELAERLAQPSFIDMVMSEMNPRFVEMLEAGVAADMYLSDDGADGSLIGLTLGQVASDRRQGVAETAIQLLSEAGENVSSVHINERWADWVDLVDALGEDDYLIMGDGKIGALDGPLSSADFALSDWGYATRMIGEFVRDRAVTTLESAVKRMTSMPAAQIGLTDRGLVKEGYFADLVVFDLNTIGWGGSPSNLHIVSTGIESVAVNGSLVIQDGRMTPNRPGVVGIR